MINIAEATSDGKRNFVNIIKGSGIAIVITMILILIFSLILTYTKMPETMIPISTIVMAGFSILIGAILSSLHIKKSGILNGGLIGLIYIAILYIISSIFGAGFGLNLSSLIMIIVAILTGAIGGIIGVNLKK